MLFRSIYLDLPIEFKLSAGRFSEADIFASTATPNLSAVRQTGIFPKAEVIKSGPSSGTDRKLKPMSQAVQSKGNNRGVLPFSEGDRVRHATFGEAAVISSSGFPDSVLRILPVVKYMFCCIITVVTAP